MVVDYTRNVPIDIALAVHDYQQTKSTGARLKALKSVLNLVRELAGPSELQALHKENMMELVTLRTLISLNAFRHLPEQGSISSQELAQKTGAEESLLLRLLRMASSAGIINHLPDKTFAHTKFSRAYAADIGTGIAFQVFYDESFQPLTRLHQYLKEKNLREPDELEHCPVLWATGNEGQGYWDIMQADPERLAAFQKGMRASQQYLSSTGPYDFGLLAHEAGDRPVLVDVGGGHGQTLVEILKNHPAIPSDKVILQDLPKVVVAARDNNLLPEDVKILDYNYNDPQPIKGNGNFVAPHDLLTLLRCKSVFLSTRLPLVIRQNNNRTPEECRAGNGAGLSCFDCGLHCARSYSSERDRRSLCLHVHDGTCGQRTNN